MTGVPLVGGTDMVLSRQSSSEWKKSEEETKTSVVVFGGVEEEKSSAEVGGRNCKRGKCVSICKRIIYLVSTS